MPTLDGGGRTVYMSCVYLWSHCLICPLATTVPAGAEPFDSGDLFSGHTWQYTFDTPGQYTYYCRYHAGEQMFATLVVEAP